MKPLLLIIDMQKGFFEHPELEEQKEQLVANINQLITEFRNKNFPVIWIKQSMKADLSDAPLRNKKQGKAEVAEGTEDNNLIDGLDYGQTDILIVKKRYSGFFKTDLDEVLGKLNPDVLVVCGINTHACVRTTVIDAYMRDYEVIIAKDCVGSYDKEHNDVSLKYLATISQIKTNSEILELLGKKL